MNQAQIDDTEEQISGLKDRILEITQAKQKKRNCKK